MNVRKAVDYAELFTAVDRAVSAVLPQMELYREIGRLISERPEKGAAVAVAEHVKNHWPGLGGFSPRNVRRMREFYRAYENAPEIIAKVVEIGWARNVVILEAELSMMEREWYICATQRYGWSKQQLAKKISESVHDMEAPAVVAESWHTEESIADRESKHKGLACGDRLPVMEEIEENALRMLMPIHLLEHTGLRHSTAFAMDGSRVLRERAGPIDSHWRCCHRSKRLQSQSKCAGVARDFAARRDVLSQPYCVYGKEKQRSIAAKGSPGRSQATVNTASKRPCFSTGNLLYYTQIKVA